MRNKKVFFISGVLMTLLSGNAFASTSSQILVMSSQLYAIGHDLTSGLFPTSVVLIAIGLWAVTHVFGKNIGEGIHQLTNVIAVGGIVFFASSLLINAALFSAVV